MLTEQLLQAVMALPAESRIELAQRLLDSVDPVDEAAIDAAWVVEANRRLDDLERGDAHTIPAEQVFDRLNARRQRP